MEVSPIAADTLAQYSIAASSDSDRSSDAASLLAGAVDSSSASRGNVSRASVDRASVDRNSIESLEACIQIPIDPLDPNS